MLLLVLLLVDEDGMWEGSWGPTYNVPSAGPAIYTVASMVIPSDIRGRGHFDIVDCCLEDVEVVGISPNTILLEGEVDGGMKIVLGEDLLPGRTTAAAPPPPLSRPPLNISSL